MSRACAIAIAIVSHDSRGHLDIARMGCSDLHEAERPVTRERSMQLQEAVVAGGLLQVARLCLATGHVARTPCALLQAARDLRVPHVLRSLHDSEPR